MLQNFLPCAPKTKEAAIFFDHVFLAVTFHRNLIGMFGNWQNFSKHCKNIMKLVLYIQKATNVFLDVISDFVKESRNFHAMKYHLLVDYSGVPYRISRVDQSWNMVISALGALSELEQSSPRVGDLSTLGLVLTDRNAEQIYSGTCLDRVEPRVGLLWSLS